MANKEFLQITGGEVFIETYNADGTLAPMISFGKTDEMALSSEVEKIEHYDTESCETVLDGEAVVSRTANISFTTGEVSPDMLGRAYLGEAVTTTQTAVADDDQTATGVIAGGRYNLGGYRNVTSVVVKNDDDSITYEEGIDYKFASKAGYIVIVSGAGIADGDDLNLTVTAPDGEVATIDAMKKDSLTARITFSGCASVGESNEYVFEKVKLQSDGDIQLKGKEYTTISFSGSVLKTNGKYFTVTTY